jgi:glycosyltransferase involved in cell wall biosynthesis
LNIGFLTSEYPHVRTGTSGGIGTSIKNLADALTKLNHRVTVFVYGQAVDSEFSDGRTNIVQIQNVKFKGFSWYLTRKKIQNIINENVSLKKLNIIEAPDWTGITAFMKLKCPLVIKLHGSDTYFCHLDKRTVRYRNFFQEKKALGSADAHVSVSAFTAETTNRIFNQNLKYEIIPNGITLPEHKYLEMPTDEIQINRKILYAGTLIRKKGVLELPLIFNEVIKLNKSAELVIAGGDTPDIKTGGGSTWDLMKPLFSPEAFEQVNYEGRVPYDRMSEFYRLAEVCVFPSYAEAFPVSWLEAMAMGKAVVASDIGWAHEVIEDGISGILCNPADPKKFAGNIADVLIDKRLRTYLGDNARSRVKNNFSAEIIADKTFDFYKRVIDGRK